MWTLLESPDWTHQSPPDPLFVNLDVMVIVNTERQTTHWKGSMKGEERGVQNVSFRWWRKLECPGSTSGQPQVNDNLLTWIPTLVRISLSYGCPNPLRVDGV